MGNAKIFYGTCDTAAATVAKVVTCPDFTAEDLVKGALIFVTFDYTNSGAVANLTLNVNGTGAKNIKKLGGNSSGTTLQNLDAAAQIQTNQTYLFQYDGTYWVCISLDWNTNTIYNVMTQAQADAGTDTTGYRITPAILHQKILNMLETNQSDWEETDTTAPTYIKNKPSDSTQTTSDVVFTKHSISDNVTSAKIKEVRGKSLVWNQLLRKTATYVNYSNSEIHDDGEVISYIPSVMNGGLFLYVTKRWIVGHVYYFVLNGDGGATPYKMLYFTTNSAGIITDNYSRNRFIVRCRDTSSNAWLWLRGTTGEEYRIKRDFQIIDLTLMFGAGNEPATVEEFEALFPAEYYEYNEGEIINNKTEKLGMTGFNQWDEELFFDKGLSASGQLVTANGYQATSPIPLLPGFTYYFKSPKVSNYQVFYDASMNVIYAGSGYGAANGVKNYPDGARFMRLQFTGYGNTYNNDICINISDPAKNGTYESYKSTDIPLNLPTITGKLNGEGDSVVVFPEGMRSAGTAYDYLIVDADGYARRAVKVMESVDMGTLVWTKQAATSAYKQFFGANLSGIKPISTWANVLNAVCNKYILADGNAITLNSGKNYFICGQPNTEAIRVNDDAYTDAATFKSAMSGVELVYELATPQEYVLDTPIHVGSYAVEQNGTEERLPADTATSVTAPFSGIIQYGLTIGDLLTEASSKQDTLISGTNIKTINNESLLGSGNITISADTSACELLANKVTSLSSASTDAQYPSAKCVYDNIAGKQDALISGENVKTINNNSILGSGDISVGTVTGSGLTNNAIVLGSGTTGIKTSSKTIVTTLGTNDTTIPTSKAVKDAIDALPEPMQFKGTVGTGGTITTLPAAAAGNTGYTYKVITNGTYQSIAAKAGDTFISNGSSWTLIPSGDEPSGTVTNIATGTGLIGGPITTTGTISIDTDVVAQISDIPTQTTVSGWGFTKNTGTITGITMNGASKGTSGVVNLGTVITSETQPDWNVTNTSSAAYIKNKPTIPSVPTAMTATEANTGTATTARTITAAVLAGAINNKITCMTQNEVDATVNTIFS